MHYYDKFSHQRFAASVRQFGGKPVEGCIVITSTGMVGVVGLNRGSHGGVITATASLGSIRHRITTVDICFGKSEKNWWDLGLGVYYLEHPEYLCF